MAAASSASAGFWPTKAAPDARRVLGRWPPNATHLETEAQTIAEADVAATFRRLHPQPEPLVLANAWAAGSARLIESLGSPEEHTPELQSLMRNSYAVLPLQKP